MPFNILTPASSAESSVSIPVDTFKRFIKFARQVVPDKTTIPILGQVLIYSDNGKGYLLATNLECFVRVEINGAGKGKLDMTVGFKALDMMISRLSSGSVLVELNGTMLSFKSGAVRFEMAGSNGIDYPVMKRVTGISDKATWTTQELRYVVQNIASVASVDSSRLDLQGVLVSIDGDTCDFMASDRHTLVCTSEAHDNRYNIPKILFNVLTAVEFMQPINVEFGSDTVKVSCGSMTTTCTYIKIPFPAMVNSLIPKTFKYQYKLNVVKLRGHLTKMINLSNRPADSGIPVAVNLKKNTFYVDMMDVGCTSAETVDEDSWIKLDARRWLHALERFNDVVDISAGFNEPNSPTLWWDTHAKTIVMPMVTLR